MADTTNLVLPLIAASQAQKHVTHNDALLRLDALVELSIIDRDLTVAPGSPAEADRYIVGASATGAWAGQDGKIAAFLDGVWTFLAPRAGWRAWVEDEGLTIVHNGTSWLDALAASPFEATTAFKILEEEVTVASGAFVDSTIQIPNRGIVLGVSTRTTQAVAGATSYDCGVSGNTSQFGGTLGVALGSTNAGVIGPSAFFAATAIRLTANGSNFTGGKIRVAIHFIEVAVPTS